MINPNEEKLFKSKFSEFLAQHVDEKDRTAIILVSAKIEYHLGQAIAARLLPCTSVRDDLLENDGYLGTFESRISAAYRLGIIDDKFARALNLSEAN